MKPRCLGICLFFNDDDIVEDALTHLLENNHELVVWDHGSNDGTAAAIDKFNHHIRERFFLPRTFDFEKIFEHVSRHVIDNYAAQYDWISFPESDEILEGPDRQKSYYGYVEEVVDSPYDWVQFNNIVYWFTEKDDPNEPSPRKRIRHYSIWRDCAPRVYAWRASCMNIRRFNHNPPLGKQYPVNFNTCHYQVRSEGHMIKRIEGRIGLSKGISNLHFDYMEKNKKDLYIPSEELNFDDGVSDLCLIQTFNWRKIYGAHDAMTARLRTINESQTR